MPTGNPSGKGYKFPIGHTLVPYGSPLHVSELFLQILKIHFGEFPEGHPFRYTDDFETSGIAFDIALNKESGIYGVKPLVVLSRGNQTSDITILGDLGAAKPMLMRKACAGMYACSQNFNILSKSRPEVEIIGEIIYSLIMFRRVNLPSFLNLHMIQNLTLSEAARMEDDDAMFMVQGAFSYLGQYIWKKSYKGEVFKSSSVNVGLLGKDQPEQPNKLGSIGLNLS